MGDMFNSRRNGGRVLAIVVSQIAIAPFVIASRFLPGDYYLLIGVCYCIGSILITIMYGPVLATIQELSQVRLRATTVALLMIGLNIFGASLGSVLAAWLTGFLHSYTWGIFITAQAGLLSIPFFLLAYRRYETDLARLGNLHLGEQKIL
jgi:MFS family permease